MKVTKKDLTDQTTTFKPHKTVKGHDLHAVIIPRGPFTQQYMVRCDGVIISATD